MKTALVALLIVAAALAAPTPNNIKSSYKLQGTLIEKVHVADSNETLCDPVKQYSGYYKLTTGDKHCELCPLPHVIDVNRPTPLRRDGDLKPVPPFVCRESAGARHSRRGRPDCGPVSMMRSSTAPSSLFVTPAPNWSLWLRFLLVL